VRLGGGWKSWDDVNALVKNNSQWNKDWIEMDMDIYQLMVFWMSLNLFGDLATVF